jgi:hypothetical protein
MLVVLSDREVQGKEAWGMRKEMMSGSLQVPAAHLVLCRRRWPLDGAIAASANRTRAAGAGGGA